MTGKKSIGMLVLDGTFGSTEKIKKNKACEALNFVEVLFMVLAFIIWSIVAIIFMLIGISAWKSKQEVGFFTFSKPPKMKDDRLTESGIELRLREMGKSQTL